MEKIESLGNVKPDYRSQSAAYHPRERGQKSKTTPKFLDLTVYSSFKASHSLEGFETPHFHEWKIAAEFRASFPLASEKLIDLVFLQKTLAEIVRPIEGTFLNQQLHFAPTSEKMAEWLWARINKTLPEAPLYSVSITLCDLEGHPTGKARLGAGN